VAITWDGSAVALVRSAVRRIDGAENGDAVLDALRAVDTRHELTFTFPRAADGVDVPARAAALRARPVDAAALAPRMAVWVDVVVDGAVYRTVQVPVDVVREQRVLVARTELRAGTVDVASFQVAARNVAGQHPVVAADLPDGAPVRLARPLRAGQVLTADALMPADGVAPGDRVLVVARAGGAGVELEGVVVHGGRRGQAVDVLVAHSAQAIAGILLDSHTVSVR
jgi:flagella basal body P-ring formation protein FlgA